MKKFFILLLFYVSINAWSQSSSNFSSSSNFRYNANWGGTTFYSGSGKATFDEWNRTMEYGNSYLRIERPSNLQIDIIKYGLRQYAVRTNDVYIVFFINGDRYNVWRQYSALVIITTANSNNYNFEYCLYEFTP